MTTPVNVANSPIVNPVKKKDFVIELLLSPKVFKIAISLVLFFIKIVSPETILKANNAGLSGIACAAGSVLVIDFNETIRVANKKNITLFTFNHKNHPVLCHHMDPLLLLNILQVFL